MNNTIVLATNNRHKIREIHDILKRACVKIKILTLDDFPKFPPVIENKKTILGNAIKKAKEVAVRTGHWALSDDTGLFIDALQGRPGVYSARFAGPGCSFEDNVNKVLRLMQCVPPRKRGADFRTVAALVSPRGETYSVEGKIRGKIPERQLGVKGFGYDPVFYVPKFRMTYAEMPAHLKNKISHRGLAFTAMAKLIKKQKLFR